MPIETDQQYLERVVKEQAEQIEGLKNMVVKFLRKIDYLEEIYDHYDPEEDADAD
tara:strand:+ start:1260 stop:1424 length:165 start_codon:yes stop_codon:yes gene_type:complete